MGLDPNGRRALSVATVLAASCAVYDPSLLVGGAGPGSGASGGSGDSGESGAAGRSTGGSSGSSSGGSAGGARGGEAGRGGGGATSAGRGGTGGGAGMGAMSDAGEEGNAAGEAGMGSSTGGTMGGSSGGGGTSGTSGGGGAGNAGNGGTSAKGGTEGQGGSGGAATGGMGGAGAGGGTATGCGKLTVPLNESTDQARFAIALSSSTDLSMTGATLSVSFYVQSGGGGSIAPFVQDTPDFHFLRGATANTALSGTGTWRTINWNVAAEPLGSSTTTKSAIIRVGVEIAAAPATGGWGDPTVVFLDSISVSTGSLSFPFDSSGTVYPTPTSSGPASQLWLNNHDEDTLPETLTGTTVAWASTCP